MKTIFYLCLFFNIISYTVYAQDSVEVLSSKKPKLSFIKKLSLRKKRKKTNQTTDTPSTLTVARYNAKLSQTTSDNPSDKKPLKKRNTALENVRIASSPDTEFTDHPNLAQIDLAWKNELVNNYLFDEMEAARLQQNYNEIEYTSELSTETLKERLKVLNAKTPFNIEYNPQLESVINNYLRNRKKTMSRLIKLSGYYFPMFEEILDKHDLPLEIKYLAIVESALKPNAKSRVGATGLWQFMYSTGKMYDLNVSSYVDERMDPIRSTEAAALYLSKLYDTFEDWDLALAAYNSGPGNVTKAIRRSGGYKNFWGIRNYLPNETAGYVPAFLATLYLFEYAEAHGMVAEKPKFNSFITDTIQIQKQVSLKHVARYLQMDHKELQFLNPSYKVGIIPKIAGKNYTLRLPNEKIGVFLSNEQAIYEEIEKELKAQQTPPPEYVAIEKRVRYKIRNGDNLGSIAERFGVKVSQIRSWNNLRSSRIRAGKYLTIYPRKVDSYISSRRHSSGKHSSRKTHTVRSGESLWTISRKYDHLSIKKLKALNNLTSSSLKPGMKLIIHK